MGMFRMGEFFSRSAVSKQRPFVVLFALLCLAMTWLCPVLGHAAENETSGDQQKVYKLDQVSVTATRTERPIMDVPSSVSIIDESQIEASPFERVEDILRTEVGLDNAWHYGMQRRGIKGTVHMRGVTGGITQRTLILIDGVPQNDNANNSIGWIAWSQIPKDAIKRIEVVRGPTSALYGSEGLGGVINIITKRPKEEREAFVSFGYGESDTHSEEAFYSKKFGSFGALLNGRYEESDGFYMEDPVTENVIRRDRRSTRVYSKLAYDINDRSNIDFSFLHYRHKMNKGRPFFYGEKEDYRYWLDYSNKGDGIEWKALAYINDDEKDAFIDQKRGPLAYQTVNRKENFPVLTWGGELQSSMSLLEDDWLTLGVAYKDVHFETDYTYYTEVREYEAEGDQEFISPFLNYEKKFFDDRLIVNVGGRYDYIESENGKERDTGTSRGYGNFDNVYPSKEWKEFSPKGGIVYRPDRQTAIRASVGTGFRAPTLFELYKTHTRGGGVTIANPDLEPEEILSYDIGAERVFLESIWGRVTYYWSVADELIATRTIDAARNWNERDNLEEVSIHGMETELEWRPKVWLSMFVNYTYNQTEIEEDPVNPENEGNLVSDYPEHKVRAGVTYANPKLFNVTLLYRYEGERYQDIENTVELSDYSTWALSISRVFRDRVKLSLDIENIFDREYVFAKDEVEPNTVAPGRIVMGSVKFMF